MHSSSKHSAAEGFRNRSRTWPARSSHCNHSSQSSAAPQLHCSSAQQCSKETLRAKKRMKAERFVECRSVNSCREAAQPGSVLPSPPMPDARKSHSVLNSLLGAQAHKPAVRTCKPSTVCMEQVCNDVCPARPAVLGTLQREKVTKNLPS